MPTKRRQTILAAVALLLLASLVAFFFFSDSTQSAASLRRTQTARREELKKLERSIRTGQAAVARRKPLDQRALPSGPDARTLYNHWLGKLVEDTGLKIENITPSNGSRRVGVFDEYRYTVAAEGTLDQLLQLLYGFYAAGHLHQIENLSLNPLGKTGKDGMKINITISALSMPSADRKDALSEVPGDHLARASLNDYRKAVLRRRMENDRYVEGAGLLQAYQPPPKKPPEHHETPAAPFDHAQQTIVTALTEVDGRPEVWLWVKTTGEQFHLGVGDEFKVGPAQGIVTRVGERDAELIFDGKPIRVALGESLRGAMASGS